MAIPTYEIYALKYAGPFTRPAPMVNWFQDMDKRIRINYYIFVIRGEGETIIVDCGCSPELARERDLAGYVNPSEVLKRIDIDAGEVNTLVVTHIHFDHISGIGVLPQHVGDQIFRRSVIPALDPGLDTLILNLCPRQNMITNSIGY